MYCTLQGTSENAQISARGRLIETAKVDGWPETFMLLFRTVVASTERIVNQMEDGLNKARGERLLKLFTRSMFYCGEVRLQADNRLLVSGISIAGSTVDGEICPLLHHRVSGDRSRQQ
ncbi:unnamed protein product, partial [Symbiodinium natans]